MSIEYIHVSVNGMSHHLFDERRLAAQILLAALSIPLQPEEDGDFVLDYDIQREKDLKMASLLGFDDVEPKRDTFLQEIVSFVGCLRPDYTHTHTHSLRLRSLR